MTTHLIIPDSHDEPEVSKERFTWLGNMIVDIQPDVIVCLGDFADMSSLSSYDKGRRSHEGKRYRKDIDSVNEAIDTLEAPIRAYNAKAAVDKKKRYKPRKVFLYGNHEDRIDRATQSNAELDGAISKDDMKWKEHGWSTHKFLEIINIDGVHYSHYFVSGVMGRPISGENIASSILKKHHVSTVAGHIHTWDFAERTRADGQSIQGLIAGCYFNHPMNYAFSTQKMWWPGITVLKDVKHGTYDFERTHIDRMKKLYG
jgi:hypothetical protein